MAINIPLNHPTLELKSKIQELSQHFLESLGFNYFQYLRCFADGSIGLLTNDTGLLEYLQHIDNAPVVFSSYENEHQNSHSYWFLWDEELPSTPVQLARDKFNLHSGLTLVRRYKDHYDMIAVALPKAQANPGAFYLNKLKAIEHFVNLFDSNHSDLIQIMNHNPIALPPSSRDVNYQNICLNNSHIKIQGKQQVTHITSQELACLRYLIQGHSHKKAAQLLNISPRTVETYLLRIKQRTGFCTLAELERLMLITV